MKARFSRVRALPPARVGCRTSRCSGASCNPRVLLLGCGVGNLATILARAGKQIDVVDCNPTSFDIAREYFSMPKEIACVSAAFGQFLAEANEKFDGIDVGGPGFCYEEKFDAATCSAVVGGIHIRGDGRFSTCLPEATMMPRLTRLE